MGTVLFPSEHIGELCAIPHQVTELADVGRQDKAGLDHAAHIQIADPFGVLAVSPVPLFAVLYIWGALM